MMNSDEQWLLYLWSGVFGAAIGGLVAGAGAMVVLILTNRHQTKQTEIARLEARRDAQRQLEQQQSLAQGQIQAQRVAHNKQLSEQREILERQLDVQRQLAALEREIAVRSEMLELLSQFDKALSSDRDFDFKEQDRKISILLHRWRINLAAEAESELRFELQLWEGQLSDLVAILEPADTHDRARQVLNYSLTALGDASINHREMINGRQWTSQYTADYLEGIRVKGIACKVSYFGG